MLRLADYRARITVRTVLSPPNVTDLLRAERSRVSAGHSDDLLEVCRARQRGAVERLSVHAEDPLHAMLPPTVALRNGTLPMGTFDSVHALALALTRTLRLPARAHSLAHLHTCSGSRPRGKQCDTDAPFLLPPKPKATESQCCGMSARVSVQPHHSMRPRSCKAW
jgi:hypothetical protein